MSNSISVPSLTLLPKLLGAVSFKAFCLIVFCLFNLLSVSAQTRAWGRNFSGQIGDGTSGNANKRPLPVNLTLSDISQLSGSGDTSVALKADGTVLTWGGNNHGQRGDGTTNSGGCGCNPTAGAVSNLTDVVAVGAGSAHGVALKADGTVWAWGANFYGQIGINNSFQDVPLPVQVPLLSNIIAIDAGHDYTLALKADGTVWSWGGNDFGQLGTVIDPANPSDQRPKRVGNPNNPFGNVLMISAGSRHCAALKKDGTLWIWGSNYSGELGNGTGSFGDVTMFPTKVNISNVAQVAVGGNRTVALKTDGTVWSWGVNMRGEIGNGTVSGGNCFCVKTPQQTLISDVIGIETMGNHTLARKRDGSVWAWGNNESGAIGNGLSGVGVFESSPVQVGIGVGNALIGVGIDHSFAVIPVIHTPSGSNVLLRGVSFNLKFNNVMTTGATTVTAINPNTTGLPLPANYAVVPNAPAYNVTSTAAFNGNAFFCLEVPTVVGETQFNSLRLMSAGVSALIDRTVSRNYSLRRLCASAPNLSQFVIAQNLAPLTSVGISGRVFAANGRGVSRTRVHLTNEAGETRFAMTNPFGYYRFIGVQSGSTYFIGVANKSFTLIEQQTLVLTKELLDLNFEVMSLRN